MPSYRGHDWRLVQADSTDFVYRRPLGNSELGFYWDSVFCGTAITINHVQVAANPELEHALFSESNVNGAWLRMKQRYPLLGASIDEIADSDVIEFVVDAESLRTRRPEEITWIEVDDAGGAANLLEKLLNGPSPLSNEYLTRLWVTKQKDVPHRYHVFTIFMHSVNDGVSGATTIREFLQELSKLSEEIRINGPPLAERLAKLMPIEDLGPIPTMSQARRRWREAAAKIILNQRQVKQTGGHTLPARPDRDFGEPAYSRTTLLSLPSDTSEQVITSCRALGITFGSALPVLSQLAISRVLHRRRHRFNEKVRQLIGEEEWDYRRIQPMHFGGPVNFRPYLNRDWFERGGANEICLAITFSYSTLPFMPTRPPSKALDCEEAGYPSFSTLLSPKRFLYRARLIQAQTERQLRCPLLYEIHSAQTPRRISLAKAVGLAWRAKERGNVKASIDVPSTYNHRQCVFTNGGASLGNRDALVPSDYPVPRKLDDVNKSRPSLHIVNSALHLRCRPSELYLGALTERKQLVFFSFADLKTYNEADVREWMEEIRNAAIHYLGRGTEARCKL